MNKIEINSLNENETEDFLKSIEEKAFRGKQVFKWINNKFAEQFNEMTNLSLVLREKLENYSYISTIKIADKLVSKDDGIIKYLFEMENNTIIESVLMKYSYGNAVCVSTQAGCKMGCSFCASTIGGLHRNLSAGEIAGQIYKIQKDLGERISNVVLMGCGEPFDNYENVMKFIEIVNSKSGLDLGQRSITISTCGIVDKIYDFAERNIQVNLAISLHAPNNEIRTKIMPIGKKYKIEQIIEACKYYCNTTKRRVTYEYALIAGLNDSKECAIELAKKLRHSLCHVNLIPINNVSEKNYKATNLEDTKAFSEILKSYGIQTTIRRKLGSDINASCGQLRKKYLEI